MNIKNKNFKVIHTSLNALIREMGKANKEFCLITLISTILLLMFVSTTSASPYTYITNSGSNNVSVIDTATNDVISTVDVGTEPYGVAINPSGTSVYVTNLGSNSVSVIDTTTNMVANTINVGNYPVGVAVSPDGTKAYVTNYWGNSISVIDCATSNVTATINIENNPEGVSVSPDGTKLYVTSYAGNILSIIDTTTNNIISAVSVGTNPVGIAVSPDGSKLYVANEKSDNVSVIDTATNTVTDTINVGSYPYGITVSPDGKKVYVTNYHSSTISVIDTATNTVTDTLNGASGFEGGIEVTPDGTRVYATNYYNNTVLVIDTATNNIIATVPVGNGPVAFGKFIGYIPSQPVLPIANFSTNITGGYVPLSVQFTDLSENATNVSWDFENDGTPDSMERNPIHVYTAPGNYTVNLTANNENGTNSKLSTNIVVNKGQFAYITNSDSNNVSIIDINTDTLINTVNAGNHPIGVAVTSDATKVYVANELDNNVSVIDTATNTIVDAINVGQRPIGIAVNPAATKIYVINYGSDTVSVVDAAANNIIATIPVGVDPLGVSVTPDGKKTYVSNTASNTVSIINTTTNTITKTVNVGLVPIGIAVNPSGTKAYTVNYGSNNVSVIDTTTDSVINTTNVGINPIGIAINPTGTKIYVTNSDENTVSVIDTSTDTVTATVPVGNLPGGVMVDSTGSKIYVANGNSDTVSVINASTNTVIATLPVGDYPRGFGQFIGYIPPQPGFPIANFSSNVTDGYVPLSVQFTDLSENATNVSWDFENDGTPDSMERNPIHVYTLPGNYTVNLTASSEMGADSKTVNISAVWFSGLSESINSDGILETGEYWTYTGNYTVTQADINNYGGGDGFINNTATVEGEDIEPISKNASVPLEQKPAYTIEKIVLDVATDGPDGNVTKAGDIITYQIKVNNTGNVEIMNISVSDSLIELSEPLESITDNRILEIGEYWIYTGNYTVTQEDMNNNGGGDGFIDNTATVACDNLESLSDSTAVKVIQNPDYSLEKVVLDVSGKGPQGNVTKAGDVITYQIRVNNTGNIDLKNVTISDPLIGLP